MMKQYLDMNVYEAAKERVRYIFDEFDNIYVSFSGGKDSGVCMHLMCDEARRRNRKIGVLFIDTEAQYQFTIEYVESILKEYTDVIKPMWVCLPMETDNNLSYSEMLWSWWDPDKKDVWVRDIPKNVINLDNNPIDYYRYKMTFEEFVSKFGKWYGKGEKTACIIGIRTQESLNRWRAIKGDKSTYNDIKYSTKVDTDVYNFYPIYDWTVEDVWTFYGKTGHKYNKFYDLMYQAGISIHKMRIDEPFGDEAKAGLNMFRILEPQTWGKVVNRVSGANFGNIYSGTKINSHKYQLPRGHTWKSFTEFLLNTLPEEAANHYKDRFEKFINWWIEKGSGMTDEEIDILESKYGDKIINTHERSKRGKGDKNVIKFKEVIDEIPELDTKQDVLSWKRMAMCIIKNDYWCKSLSFGITKEQQRRRKEAMEKYKEVL
ncbi:DUF3440 domain-containing protein [Staphylococcus pseudintermedius]|nr:DUF3440 domain-containing protein [Staphylococcus pseudintermedius]EGQ2844171.1 DUF3440 domain-containing protein [Staphylococcus pseudintermedius]EGQ3911819.1 DUF3440 domain-containing protein [Staphylococcus pseudintermedius]EGQ4357221.1 DUF3440 domain-containing protein [Staphylococcus pseudintermedius]